MCPVEKFKFRVQLARLKSPLELNLSRWPPSDEPSLPVDLLVIWKLGSLEVRSVTSLPRLARCAAGGASVASAYGDARGQPRLLPSLPRRVCSAGDGVFFSLS